jgi:hypothetical protein
MARPGLEGVSEARGTSASTANATARSAHSIQAGR